MIGEAAWVAEMLAVLVLVLVLLGARGFVSVGFVVLAAPSGSPCLVLAPWT